MTDQTQRSTHLDVRTGLVLLVLVLSQLAAREGLAADNRGAPAVATPRPSIWQRPISLRQAWHLALQAARSQWGGQVVMAELSSIDAAGDASGSGVDGRRRAWMATLVLPNQHAFRLEETISDGVIVQRVKVPAPTPAPPMRQEPKVDSPVAVETAIAARPDLGPGTAAEHGFSFVAHIDVHGRPVIAVMGSFRAHPEQVDVDARSGRVLGTLIYTWTSRVPCSTDAGETWRTSNLTGALVPGISPLPGSSKTAYALVANVHDLQLWESVDGGCFWRQISELPSKAGAIAHDLTVVRLPHAGTVIAAGTSAGLWTSRDGGTLWRHDTTLNVKGSDGVQWLAAGWLGMARAIVVTLSSGLHAGLYASSNLRSWHRISNQVYRLSVTDNGNVAVALSDDGSGTGYINRQGETASPLRLPVAALRAAGQFVPGRVELAESAGAVARSSDGGRHWTAVLQARAADGTLTGLAVGQGFPGNKVSLTSGINGTIFRSTDAGRTWRRMRGFTAPSGGEAGNVRFLGTRDAVMVETGPATWSPF